jgi:hypothetical protein
MDEANRLWERGVEGGLHPCTLRPPAQVRDFLHLRTQHVNTVHCILLYNTIFLLCRLKINHVKELRHLRLFLSLLTWLQICIVTVAILLENLKLLFLLKMLVEDILPC